MKNIIQTIVASVTLVFSASADDIDAMTRYMRRTFKPTIAECKEDIATNLYCCERFIRDAEDVAKKRIATLESFTPSNIVNVLWWDPEDKMILSDSWLREMGMDSKATIEWMNVVKDALLDDYRMFVTNEIWKYKAEVERLHREYPSEKNEAGAKAKKDASADLATRTYLSLGRVDRDFRVEKFCSTRRWHCRSVEEARYRYVTSDLSINADRIRQSHYRRRRLE